MPPIAGRILAVANQKGGVGKTTTAINLATALGAAGRRVLLVDLDPQGNASTGFGVARADRRVTTYEVLLGTATFEAAVLATAVPQVDLVPATVDLSAAEVELVGDERRAYRLRDAFKGLSRSYDHVLIDCPPSLSLLTLNALAAADSVLVPMQCEYFALEGIAALTDTMDAVKRRLNPKLEIEGIVRTMYDVRNNLASAVSAELQRHFGDKVYRTVIPRNVRLAEAPSHGQSIVEYDRASRGGVAYLGLAGEIIGRERGGSGRGEKH
jgi:chromosome partitioning protein